MTESDKTAYELGHLRGQAYALQEMAAWLRDAEEHGEAAIHEASLRRDDAKIKADEYARKVGWGS